MANEILSNPPTEGKEPTRADHDRDLLNFIRQDIAEARETIFAFAEEQRVADEHDATPPAPSDLFPALHALWRASSSIDEVEERGQMQPARRAEEPQDPDAPTEAERALNAATARFDAEARARRIASGHEAQDAPAERRTVAEGGTYDPTRRFDLSTTEGTKAWEADTDAKRRAAEAAAVAAGYTLLRRHDVTDACAYIAEVRKAVLDAMTAYQEETWDTLLESLAMIASRADCIELHITPKTEAEVQS